MMDMLMNMLTPEQREMYEMFSSRISNRIIISDHRKEKTYVR